MSELVLEVKPKGGLGEIKFGDFTKRVIALIGEPGNVEEISTDDFVKTTILTFSDGITIFLEGILDPMVSHIDVYNKNATLFGEKIFDMKEAEIIQLMNNNGFNQIEKEDEEWGETRLTFDDALMDFYFVETDLVAVNWGVIIGTDGLSV
ncbi:MAG: hypothetical protein KAH25_11535 [Bacteroidales bacterium]|nr:hypothetical protein [Bacteroidales bacterium]